MAKIPDKAEMQRRFMTLELRDRRRVIRAVNRGHAIDDRKLAVVTVGVARRQQRFWKWAWVLGPVVGMLQALFPDVTVQAAAVNSVIATGLLALLSLYWFTRARRAEHLNLELAGAARTSAATSDKTQRTGRRPRAHLPGRGGGGGGSTDTADAGDTPDPTDRESAQPQLPAQRPYRPRGQKRRG